MGQEVKLGDKIWMHYGPSVLIVGYIVEQAPNERMIAISPLPFDVYGKMTAEQKATCPVTWCELRACHYLCHTSRENIQQHDENVAPKLGFGYGTRS